MGLDEVDYILFLDFPVYQLYKRVIFRWLKQGVGIEASNYKPTVAMLSKMLKWATTSSKRQIQPFLAKTTILRNKRDNQNYSDQFEV